MAATPTGADGPPAKRVKLTGRAFYESLGSPKLILAPMVDQSEFAWRLLTRSFVDNSSGNLIAYSPMLHARLFNETQKYRDRSFLPVKRTDGQGEKEPLPGKPYLDGNPKVDRPLFVQFCANDPDEFLHAAQHVENYCDAVDLNLGCPQGIARKGKYGAFLQEEQDLIFRLINKLHTNLSIPVTAKIRVLGTKEQTLTYAKMVLEAGASILTVHGRRREQKGHITGLADWTVLKYLREQLPAETVLFANGNILQHEDIARCLEATGFDGVMSAEGNLCDPSIFAAPPAIGSEGREYWRGKNGKGGWRMDAVFRRYLDIIHRHVLEEDPPHRDPLYIASDGKPTTPHAQEGDSSTNEPPAKRRRTEKDTIRTTNPSLMAMQGHLFHMMRPLVSRHTDIRDKLAKCRGGNLAAFEEVLQMTERAVCEGLWDYHNNADKYDDGQSQQDVKDLELSMESSAETVKACARPWWVCQPYVRPLPKEAVEKGSITLSKQSVKALDKTKEPPVKPDGQMSKREQLDVHNGLSAQEVSSQAMVAG